MDAEEYSEETDSPNRMIRRLHEKGHLETIGYRPERAGRGITNRRYIRITPTGREVLEKVVGILSRPIENR